MSYEVPKNADQTPPLRICLVGHKIHILSRSTDTGLLWPLARGLAQHGHEVTIISSTSPQRKHEINRDGVKAYYLFEGQTPYKTLRFVDAAHKKFAQLHHEKPFDIVHCLDESGYKIGRHRHNFKTTVAYDVQATTMPLLFATLAENDGSLKSQFLTSCKIGYRFIFNYLAQDRSLLDTADGIFVTTPQQRTLLERYFLFPDYHTYTVPYGINLGNLTEREESHNFKLKYNIPEEAKIILSVSDFTNASEVRPILKAFEKIIMKNNQVYLFLVGEGPRWKDVEYDMLKLILGSRVIMPGALSTEKLIECISSSTIYIDLNSRSTGLEPSLIEAMAQKKVVIGSELSPISEIIDEGKDGFLVRPADDMTITRLFDYILQEPEITQSIGQNARHKVLEFFDKDKMILSLQEAYFEIIQKSPFYKRRDKSFWSFFKR